MAQAFVASADHIGNDSVALIAGDNVFNGPNLGTSLSRSDSLLDAGDYVRTIERRQGLKIGVSEEGALRLGFIDDEQASKRARTEKSGYGADPLQLIEP